MENRIFKRYWDNGKLKVSSSGKSLSYHKKNILVKYLLSILVLTLTANLAVSQEFTMETLTGNWTVVQVMVTGADLSDEDKGMMDILKKGYTNSKFNFKADGKFTIQFPEEAPDLMSELKFLNDKDWKYSHDKKLISIGTRDDNYNHMRMFVKREGGKIYFAFNDTPLILEMQKDPW